MVLVVVVVLPGFEAFKQLANFSRADFNFCHIRPAGNIQRNFRQKFNRRTMPLENGLSPPLPPSQVLKLNLETNPIFHTFKTCAVLVVQQKTDWTTADPVEDSNIMQSELIHDVCQSQSDLIKLRQTHLGSKSELWHPRHHQLVKLPLLNFQRSRQEDIDTMTDISVISDLLNFLVTSDITALLLVRLFTVHPYPVPSADWRLITVLVIS